MATVMVVDDHEDTRFLYKRFLAKLGHDVIVVNDGQEAVDRMNEEKPDLILMDIMMPRKNGIQATREIRVKTPKEETRIIALSQTNSVRQHAMDAGCDAFHIKVGDPKRLKGIMSDYLPKE